MNSVTVSRNFVMDRQGVIFPLDFLILLEFCIVQTL